jgi:hypothetical protein
MLLLANPLSGIKADLIFIPLEKCNAGTATKTRHPL